MHILVTQEHRAGKHTVRMFHSFETAVKEAWKAQEDKRITLCSLCLDHPYEDSLTYEESYQKFIEAMES